MRQPSPELLSGPWILSNHRSDPNVNDAPNAPTRDEVTELLLALPESGPSALDRLLPAVYPELRRIARRELARERPGHTLDSGALIHETYLKLAHHDRLTWENRAHFFAIAARAMRTILIDHARTRARAKRGGGPAPVSLDHVPTALDPEDAERLVALDQALTRLAEVSQDASKVVECRYFAGLTLEEIAAVLAVSVSTVRRRWDFARAWLYRELREIG